LSAHSVGERTDTVHWRYKASEWHRSKSDDVTAHQIAWWDIFQSYTEFMSWMYSLMNCTDSD